MHSPSPFHDPLPKNVRIIRAQVIRIALVGLGGFSLVCLALGRPLWIGSAMVGLLFSFLIYDQLIRTQVLILRTQQKKVVFPKFLFRLGLYAVPVSASLAFSEYFNFIILLIFLMAFQMIAVCYELILNLKHYKKRQKKW